MQQARRSLTYVLMIIAVIVLPTAVALGWYAFTRDPNLRPLGITREALRAYGGVGAGPEVVAYVDWVPPSTGGFTQHRLADDLVKSFRSKGVDVRVVFREGRATTRITYVVGRTTLGPFPTARAAEGVAAAVEAYRMH